ncbi:hypothetical protein Mtc_1507 [Methanocella conradii HZ254]|uniref:DUF4258 domain-containing protein n=1 Tax=Methanocella conradii (strain DSM 24694 / JCM 17849 / CGMCC 1.5162 / HZ254) TaxID=1041930 RepID=H8I625_METCZ|nr:DUF4258 domain-containing protein [Methanocella conradii]AFD00259.1 hypothetical protein Mtc_1507 [Methanocella conradii HZ254]
MSKKPRISVGHIKKLIKDGRVEFNEHGLYRSIQRNITIDQAIYTIMNGELIEKNENITPYPTAKFRCEIDGKMLIVHITQSRFYIVIRTVYWES